VTESDVDAAAVAAVFEGDPEGVALLERVRDLVAVIGPAELQVTRTQVAFRRRTGFAYAWRPGRWLRGPRPPLVLSIVLDRPDDDARWKEVAHPTARRWIHHLEVRSPDELDGQVAAWLREAYDRAA
jgi:hypothetical protein